MNPAPMGHSMHPNCVQPRISQNDLEGAARGGVMLIYRLDIFAHPAPYAHDAPPCGWVRASFAPFFAFFLPFDFVRARLPLDRKLVAGVRPLPAPLTGG